MYAHDVINNDLKPGSRYSISPSFLIFCFNFSLLQAVKSLNF